MIELINGVAHDTISTFLIQFLFARWTTRIFDIFIYTNEIQMILFDKSIDFPIEVVR